MNKEKNKKIFNFCLRDLILWIFLLSLVIYIADLQDENIYLKHILIIISIACFIFKLFTTNKFMDNIKEFALLLGCTIYLYKESYTKNIYEEYFGYLIFINVIIMSIPSFYHKNYLLALVILLLGLLTPLDFGKYDENEFYLFNVSYITIITILVLFQKGMQTWSLLALISMLPMAINYNNDPWKYRIVGILIAMLCYNDYGGLFYSKYTIKEYSPFIEKINDKYLTNHDLADTLFKYNDWKTNKLYYIITIISYIIIYKTYKYSNNNNIVKKLIL
tara:strand:- start:47 stop:874 length:828 start_codon:yes stop_codon:yes gene_type:complete